MTEAQHFKAVKEAYREGSRLARAAFAVAIASLGVSGTLAFVCL